MKQSNIENGILILTSALSVGGLVPGFQILEVASIGITNLYQLNKGKIFSPNISSELEESLNKVIEKTIKDTISEIKISDGSFILDNLQAILQYKNKKNELSQSFTYPQLQETINESLNKITKEENLYLSQQEKQKFLIELNQSFLLQLSQYPDIGVYLAHKNLQSLQQEIDELRQQIQSITQKRTYINFPYPPAPTTTFLGRETFIETIHQQLDETNLNIYAMGGVGKTDTVLYYIKQFREKYDQVIFFDYETDMETTLTPHLVHIDDVSINDSLKNAKNELSSFDKNVLIVFDNLIELTDADAQFIAQLQAKVILTSRAKKEIAGVKNQKLDFLSSQECKALFNRFLEEPIPQNQEKELDKIIKRTGEHTLAIKLLAKIYQHSLTISSLAQLNHELNQKGFNLEEFVKVKLNNNQKEANFYKHFQKLYNLSDITDENQIYILTNLCLLPSIPTSGSKIIEWLDIESQEPFDQLAKVGWIETQNKSITLHNVLAETLKLSLTPSYEDCQTLIESLAQEINYDYSDINRYNPRFFLHCQAIAQYFLAQQIQQEPLAFLYHNIAGVYRAQGDYPQALVFYEKALAINEKVSGKEHPSTVAIYHNLAGVYQVQGDYSQALEGYQKALVIREKVLGKEHPDTATTYNNIAGVCYAKGDYPQALEGYHKAIAIYEKVLGKQHPDTAATYNNIAAVYRAQGNYPQALAFYQKALEIKEKVLGKQHPSTAATYHNIALVYKAQGDYPQALMFYQKALAIFEKVLGKEHPDTAATYNNIAGVYQAQGDYPQALAFCQKALAIKEKVLGKQHPDTATTYNNIAGVYQNMGDYPQALVFYEKDLAISEKVLGKEHPSTAMTYNNIAEVYYYIGDYPQALEGYQKAFLVF